MSNDFLLRTLALLSIAAVVPVPPAIAQNATLECADNVPIYEIQGATHVSFFVDQQVTTCGVVTAVAFSGFYIQDADGDGNEDTSDGLYVELRGDKPAVGTAVRLAGTVSEIIGGGAASGNLSVTTLTDISVESSLAEQSLPDAVLIGDAGRQPPLAGVISESEIQPPINLQLAEDAQNTPFNPVDDSIDFYESLEGMRVSVPEATAVSAIRQFGTFSAEVFALSAGEVSDALEDRRTVNNGILLPADRDNRSDQNAARLQIQFDGTLFGSTDYPAISVGDTLRDVLGVMSYSFGNFEILQLGELGVSSGGNEPATTALAVQANALTIASYNVLNLSGVEGDADQRSVVAQHIVSALGSPAIVALQEVQDNNGDISDCPRGESEACAGVLDASLTLQLLVDQVLDNGGPQYMTVTVDPLLETTDDNRDDPDTFGGAALGNIRNAFLFDPSRVSLVSVQNLTRDTLAQLGVSVPNAFDGSRDPLEAVFNFNGEQVRVLNNHFSSRFGSTPVFGGPQPFVQAGEEDRAAQALAMHEVVAIAQDNNPAEGVVVLGDLNTFEFTDELAMVLPAASGSTLLVNLISTEQGPNAYSFNFEGNAQALDHIFVSQNLAESARAEYVHVNVDFPRLESSIVASDHEPVFAQIGFDVPDVPDALSVRGEVYGTKALEIFWNRLPGATRYLVFRNGQLLTETVGISLFESELEGDTRYEYIVVAINDAEAGLADGSVSLQTRPGSAPEVADALLSLEGAVYSSSAVEIFWQLTEGATDITGFDVSRDGVLVSSRDARSFFDDGLMPSTTYFYEVIPFNDAGDVGASLDIELRTRSASGQGFAGPPQVAELTALVYSSSAVELFWQMPQTDVDIESYEVFRDDELVLSEDARSKFDSGLASATEFTYSVRAVDTEGNRGELSVITVSTRP